MSSTTPATPRPRTIVEKIWDDHVVVTGGDGAPDVIGIDLHLVHEVTSPQAFDGLRERGLRVRRPGQTVATVDHSIPTTDRSLPIVDEIAAKQVSRLEENCPRVRHSAARPRLAAPGDRARHRSRSSA